MELHDAFIPARLIVSLPFTGVRVSFVLRVRPRRLGAAEESGRAGATAKRWGTLLSYGVSLLLSVRARKLARVGLCNFHYLLLPALLLLRWLPGLVQPIQYKVRLSEPPIRSSLLIAVSLWPCSAA